MSDALVTYQTEGAVATITLNRPDKRNALSAEVVRALKSAFIQADIDRNIRVAVLTGAGKAFSAGADLAALQALQEATPMENAADSQLLAELFELIYTMRKPVIAKINGHAIAGGSGLAAVCDFSVAVEGAKFGFTEVRIGFVPAIVMVYVVRKLGEAAVRDLMLRGRLLGAAEAAALGLITQVVPAAQLEDTVAALTEELATQTSASAIALTKQMLADIRSMGRGEAVAYAVKMNAFARSTADCQAGIAAFLAKTDPPWRSVEKKKDDPEEKSADAA